MDGLTVAHDKTRPPGGMAAGETRGGLCRPPGHGTEERVPTVLVVDDDPAIRRLVSSMLVLGGYQAVCAGGAAEALELLDQSAAPFDLVVTDVAMPGISGLELAEQIRRSQPGLRVGFMTGVVEDGPPGTLRKPFTVRAFLAFVIEALGRES
jgi:CheY-like chemotaxis protein